VDLSFSCRDLREGRETFPSWLVLQAFRLEAPGRTLTYEDLDHRLGEPVSAIPSTADRALSDAGWWLASLRAAGAGARRSRGLPRWPRARPRRPPATAPASPKRRWVSEAGPVLDPSAPGRVVSATTLERLAGCPFRHFLERGLGVLPVDDEEPDPDAWLDPLTRGSVLHDLYARFGRERRGREVRLDLRRDGARLRALGEAELEAHRVAVPPPSDHIFQRERTAFLRDLISSSAGRGPRPDAGRLR
jgi:ATP-dependent helicase/nuclease subunit B